MEPILVRHQSDKSLDDIIDDEDIQVTGTEVEKREAKNRFATVCLPNDGSDLFQEIRSHIRRPCPPCDLQRAYKNMTHLLERYARQTRSFTLDGRPLSEVTLRSSASPKIDPTTQRKVKKQNKEKAQLPPEGTSGLTPPSSVAAGEPVFVKRVESITAGIFSADTPKITTGNLRTLCGGTSAYTMEPFVHLSKILHINKKLQRNERGATKLSFGRHDLLTKEIESSPPSRSNRYFFTESPRYKLSYSVVSNNALSKFIAMELFNGEVRQDSDSGGLTRIVFRKKSASIFCFLFTAFVQCAPACPLFALDFCRKRFPSGQENENKSEQCTELIFPGMNEGGADSSNSSKCYLFKTPAKVYLAMVSKKRNSKVYFLDFALTGGE